MSAPRSEAYPATARIDAMRNGALNDGWQLSGTAGRAREVDGQLTVSEKVTKRIEG
jgi:hypothetical protein